MNSLSIKLPDDFAAEVEAACEREDISKSDLVRNAIAAYIARPAGREKAISALALAGDLVGCFDGGPRDLASNPRHLKDFGTV